MENVRALRCSRHCVARTCPTSWSRSMQRAYRTMCARVLSPQTTSCRLRDSDSGPMMWTMPVRVAQASNSTPKARSSFQLPHLLRSRLDCDRAPPKTVRARRSGVIMVRQVRSGGVPAGPRPQDREGSGSHFVDQVQID